MSIAVELERVQAEAATRGPAYLLTVTDDGRPHAVAVSVRWDDGAVVMSAGRTSVRNASGRPAVSLLWPPAEDGGYSLIVDGEATAVPDPAGDGGRVSIAVTRAVLHRPASTPGPVEDGACGSDCVPLVRSS
jgi:hypothetical protein